MSWWETTIVISAGILTLFNLVDKIINATNRVKEPTEDLKRRIEVLERRTEEEYQRKFESYDKEIADIKEGNTVTVKALLAILKHSIDGNNTDGLRKSEEELTNYLANK